MKPCEVVIYKGREIVIVDISNTTAEQAIAYFPQAHQIIAQFPPHSALVLTDSTNATGNKESIAAIKEFAVQNSPYIKASATVGAVGYRELIRGTIERQTERSIVAFETRTEAMDWLISQ